VTHTATLRKWTHQDWYDKQANQTMISSNIMKYWGSECNMGPVHSQGGQQLTLWPLRFTTDLKKPYQKNRKESWM
jgi:hypothetical protein